MITDLTVALWAINLATEVDGVEAWASAVDRRMGEARARGARLMVMPEYAAEQWMAFAPAGLAPDEEIPWLAGCAAGALRAIRDLPAKHDMALLAGSMPWPDAGSGDGPRCRNRAPLLLPDGSVHAQDKLCLVPGERDPDGWHLSPGSEVGIVEWEGLRIATLICLDAEQPALAARLAGADLDLLLIPSMTEQRSGYSRIFACARARAVELFAAVAVVGCVGRAVDAGGPRGTNVSGAAVFVPCEAALGHTGVVAELAPHDAVDGPGALLIAENVPLRTIREIRRAGPEVWPGAWDASHVRIGAGSG